MFIPVPHKKWLLPAETIDAELQRQSNLYLETIKQIWSKDEFELRTKEKIEELEEKLIEMKEKNQLDLVVQIEEALKNHQGNLETLDLNQAQALKNLEGVEEIVDYLLSLKAEI